MGFMMFFLDFFFSKFILYSAYNLRGGKYKIPQFVEVSYLEPP